MWDTLLNHIVEALIVVISGLTLVFTAWVRSRFKTANPPALFRFNEANERIHRILVETRVRMEAARCCVVQFRNGAKFDIKAPIFRLYMTHEVVSEGIAPCTPEWSALPASQVFELLRYLSPKDDPTESMNSHIHPIKDADGALHSPTYSLIVPSLDEGTLKSMLIHQGTAQLVITPMMDEEKVVGFVAANYRGTSPHAQDVEVLKHLENAAANITYELQKAIRDTYRSWWSRAWHHLFSSKLAEQAGTND